jgi:hypothetical protein
MSWSDFLGYLSEPNGIAVVVGIALSWLGEYAPGFIELAPRWKRLIFLGVCFVVPLVAAALRVATAGGSAAWDAAWWPALVAGAMAFAAGQVAHTRKL